VDAAEVVSDEQVGFRFRDQRDRRVGLCFDHEQLGDHPPGDLRLPPVDGFVHGFAAANDLQRDTGFEAVERAAIQIHEVQGPDHDPILRKEGDHAFEFLGARLDRDVQRFGPTGNHPIPGLDLLGRHADRREGGFSVNLLDLEPPEALDVIAEKASRLGIADLLHLANDVEGITDFDLALTGADVDAIHLRQHLRIRNPTHDAGGRLEIFG